MRWLSRIVTVVCVLVIVIGATLLLRAKMPAQEVGQRFTAWALFRDASRLAPGSPVMIAGVRIGEVTTMTVSGELARIDMRLRDDTDISVDSWITKRAESAFGDSYLEIIPGGTDEGASTARRLRSGERIIHVQEGGSTDTVLRAINRAMPKIDRALETVHDYMLSGRQWSNGTLEEDIISLDRWLAAGNIDRPIDAADRGITRFESGATSAADAVAGAKPDIARRLTSLDDSIVSARKRMRELKISVAGGLQDAREGIDRVDPTIQQIADVTSAIDEGRGEDFKGRLGRLVNNPKLADDIEDTTADVADATAALNRFRSWLGLRGEFDVYSQFPRVYLTAEIRAHRDKFYLVELEKGMLGSVPKDELSEAVGTPDYTRSQQIRDRIRFTAQFGKTFGWFQIRGGIKDSTFGIGADILLRQGKLRISTDVFGSFTPVPRLKVSAALAVFRSAYILAGVDDALNKPGYLNIVTGNTDVPVQFQRMRYGRDYFMGAELHFDDADLAMLIRVYGALLVGAL